MTLKDELIKGLKETLGVDYVATDKEICYTYSMDASPIPGHIPDIVIRPETTEEVSEVMKLVNKYKTPVYPRGAASSLVLMGVPLQPGGISLDLTRMNKIVEIDEDSMSVTVQTGITWGELEYELKKKGWYTGFVGPGPGLSATIGGGISVASAYYGSAKYGTACDILLGLEVVLPTGEIIRTGSAALDTAKRHTRYGVGLDSTGIFCGDQGIMGIKTEATLKLYPYPEAIGFFVYGYEDEDLLLKALHKMASLRIASDICFIDKEAGLDFGGNPERFLIHGKIEAHSEKELKAQLELFDKIAKDTRGIKKPDSFSKIALHDQKYEFLELAGFMGNFFSPCHKLPIFESKKVHDLYLNHIKAHKENLKKYKVTTIYYPFVVHGHLVLVPEIQVPIHDPEGRKFGVKFWKDFIENVINQGSVHYWLGKVIGDMVVEHYRPEYFDFIKRLKSTLDPNGILNPGLLKLP
ncbi:MAG: FAD-binding oxidoreductase [Candidatus Helarchaeota archaeon]|nr:FAD-binding oxidoreductase [Candidatus Helarchaeota archaeon]